MSLSSDCSGFTAPQSGVFPTGYCVWKWNGGTDFELVDSQCSDPTQFRCKHPLETVIDARDMFTGECFPLACVPITTTFSRPVGQGYGAAYDSDDQEGD